MPARFPTNLPTDIVALLDRLDTTAERTLVTFRVEAGYLNGDANEGYDDTTRALYRRVTDLLAQAGFTFHDGLYEFDTELWRYIARA
jgi:hypothetical protein